MKYGVRMRRQQQAEASRAALVAAARECFAGKGYDDTTVAEVLRRAGMARGALYHYFPDGKDELFAAVYREVDDELHRRIDALDPDMPPLDAVRESAAIFLQLCTRQDFARITVLEGPRVMASQSIHGSVLGRSVTRMRAGIAAAAEAGELDDLDVDLVTTALYGALRDLGARVATTPRGRRRAADGALSTFSRLLDGVSVPTTARVTTSARRTSAAHRESA